ncbi:ribonuclease P protein component [Mycoplasma procyoni]|uniref:ribonuclease P protein component n=1 Tax=Mycoplasma procyoni TaxID=568784 RepID=UPI00197C1663|nr:ribonuclease P protein component [Mycoplasma procyoni]MBN3534808.1 ribonuclease P protein component [Mycoplasma procyoni]
MKRNNRLKKNWEFQEIIKSKQQVVTKHLIVYYQKSNEFQLGISVPKKFANAVMRNYYRRQIKAIMNDYDYNSILYKTVLILRKGFLSLDFSQKKEEIIKIYERLRNGK